MRDILLQYEWIHYLSFFREWLTENSTSCRSNKVPYVSNNQRFHVNFTNFDIDHPYQISRYFNHCIYDMMNTNKILSSNKESQRNKYSKFARQPLTFLSKAKIFLIILSMLIYEDISWSYHVQNIVLPFLILPYSMKYVLQWNVNCHCQS